MAKKRARQTFEKMKREQAVREKRALKQERKEAARIAKALGLSPAEEAGSEPEEPATEEPATEEPAAEEPAAEEPR